MTIKTDTNIENIRELDALLTVFKAATTPDSIKIEDMQDLSETRAPVLLKSLKLSDMTAVQLEELRDSALDCIAAANNSVPKGGFGLLDELTSGYLGLGDTENYLSSVKILAEIAATAHQEIKSRSASSISLDEHTIGEK